MPTITPADTYPEMIPPTDFPLDSGTAKAVRAREMGDRYQWGLMTVEKQEISVLSRFLTAFGRYLSDRHNPDRSAEVLRRYRDAVRFYDGGEATGQKEK